MKQLLITIVAVVLVGCGESQQSTPTPEAKTVKPADEATDYSGTYTLSIPGCGPRMSIHEAADEGNIEFVKQHLADGTDVNEKDDVQMTPLHYAYTKEIAELLIENGADVNAKDDGGGTPLNDAAFSGHKEIVELLIAKGADVNAMRFDGSPLHLAIGHKEIIEILIAKGADVNSKSKAFNQTPIDAAADNKFFNQPDIIELLRKHGGKTGEELKAAGN